LDTGQPDAEKDKREVTSVIFAFFEAGKNKDLAALGRLHSSHDSFTKFDENPPYTRQNSQDAFVHEQAAFSNISDYEYQIEDLRVDLLGSTAIGTFYLGYSGIFVNDYSFEGSRIASRVRVTMVLSRAEGGWKIAHEHLSRFPDWSYGTKETPRGGP
jgi:ketosteroid isomerase-like protein